MDWYAHSIEQENQTETHVEKNKVKGVIEEITSSIGSILEENFSGIIRDVEEINRLFRRSTLFKSMSRENDQLKNLVETLKKDNDRLKRKGNSDELKSWLQEIEFISKFDKKLSNQTNIVLNPIKEKYKKYLQI